MFILCVSVCVFETTTLRCSYCTNASKAFLCRAPMLCEKCKRPDNFAALEEKKNSVDAEQLICHCILYIICGFVLCCTGYAVKQGFRLSVFVEMCFSPHRKYLVLY